MKEFQKPEKNKETTKQNLLKAVGELITQKGFESLGINAIAAQAGVSKMLIYRYFGSLDGLIAAYINQHDFWINFKPEEPGKEKLSEFIKQMFAQQIQLLRNSYALRRIYRWELTTNNKLINEIRETRETKGVELVKLVAKLSKHPEKEVAAIASIVVAAISYLVLLEESLPLYNGIPIQQEEGWKQLEEGINLLVDRWLI